LLLGSFKRHSNLAAEATMLSRREIGAMDNDTMGLAELDEDILTFDVQDDALERAAAAASGQAVTIGYCTHWYHCNWPL
jgi:hypothetical protein